MRRSISMLIVLMMTLGPFAQGVDVGDDQSLTPPIGPDLEIPTIQPTPDTGELLSNIDGFFTENLGQKGEGAGRFYCQGSPLSVAFGDDWIAYDYRPEESDQGVVVRMGIVDSNGVQPIGVHPLDHVSNFMVGDDPNAWVTGTMNYREVVYPGIYDGIDLRFYLDDGKLKYEYHVDPGACPSVIQHTYEGIHDLAVEARTGNLEIRTAIGVLVDDAPYSYQTAPNGLETVRSEYDVVDVNRVSIGIGDYDANSPLVIDPGLDFSTYLGGTELDMGQFIEVDEAGDIYVIGRTESLDFPTTPGVYSLNNNGPYDATITKMKGDGSGLYFSTYVGGSSTEFVNWGSITDEGDIIIAGYTVSTDLPTGQDAFQRTNNGGHEGYILKVDNKGQNVIFCSYLGGTSYERINQFCVTKSGDVYLAGQTDSNDFPVTTGCYDTSQNGELDGYIARIDSNATELKACTFFGGNKPDKILDVAVTKNGDVIVTGWSFSTNFPTTAGVYSRTLAGSWDIFVTKFDSDLKQLRFSTFIGGSENDSPSDIHLDENENIWITGQTKSDDLETTVGAYDRTHGGEYDIFFIKLNSSADKLLYSTYFGGSKWDSDLSSKITNDGIINFICYTNSTNMPTTDNAYDTTHNGGWYDIYVGKLDILYGVLEYGTYIGGDDYEYVGNIQVLDNTLIITGNTLSSDYPTTPGAYSTSNSGGWDIVITSFIIGKLYGWDPSEPENLTASLGDRLVDLRWDPPTDHGNVSLRGYNVYRGTSEDNLTLLQSTLPNKRRYIDMPPTVGLRYFYAVSAFNGIGEGNWTTVVNATPVGKPLAPMQPTATPGCGTISLAWGPPSDSGGLPILGYTLFRGLIQYELVLLADLGNIATYTDEGLDNGKEYFYKVLARNSMGNGTFSDVISATPVGPPREPRYLTVEIGDTRLTLEWRQPINDGGSSVLGYRIFRGPSEDSIEILHTVKDSPTTFIDINLTNGMTYYYAIQTFNGMGNSSLSGTVNGTPLGLPGIPIGLVVEAADGQVDLSWSPPETDGGTPVLRYRILRGSKEDRLEIYDNNNAEVTTYSDTGLMNGHTYYYAVYAENAIGEGPRTQPVWATPLARPDAPADLIAEAAHGVIRISWLQPLDTGGSDITQFVIYRGGSSTDLATFQTSDESTFTYKDDDVIVGTKYHYAVAAVTAAGEGPRSIVASATPYGPPGVPLNLEARPGNGEASLFWDIPDDDGASPIIGYVILRGTSPSSLRELTQLGPVTSYLDTSPTNGETYYYAIAAINEAGPGDYTETVLANPFKATTAPGKVMTLVGDTRDGKVIIQWNSPHDDGGSPINGYTVYRGDSAGTMEVIATLGLVRTWTDEDVVRGKTYYYSVAAVNDVGEGEAFAPYPVKVPKEKEGSPGFEVVLVAISLLIVIPIIARRRD